MASSAFATFALHLRRHGFKKTYSSRAGGCRVDEWEKDLEGRRLKAQVWQDGRHRLSHRLKTDHGLRELTVPTEFQNPDELIAAIEREATRQDSLERLGALPAMVDFSYLKSAT